MLDEIRKRFFSIPGLFISLGVLGFLSGIVSLFVDINSQISVKWLLLTLLLLFSCCFILLKLVSDLWQTKSLSLATNQESPIQFRANDDMLIIRKNDNFLTIYLWVVI